MWRVYVYVVSIVMNIQCKYIKNLCIRVYEVIRYTDISSVYPQTPIYTKYILATHFTSLLHIYYMYHTCIEAGDHLHRGLEQRGVVTAHMLSCIYMEYIVYIV